MFDYLFTFNLLGIITTVSLGFLLFLLYIISLFVKKSKLIKIVDILKIIFIISVISMISIIVFCLIFDNFAKNNISNKAKEYISDKYDIPIENIEISSYERGTVPGLCLDECHSKPYRIVIKSSEGDYCVNAYDLSDKYIYPTNLYWSDEKSNSNSCEEIDYELYYDLDIER